MNPAPADPLPLDEWIDSARREVDDALERYLPAPPQVPVVVAEAMRYSVRAGGKRLRPLLTLAAAEACAAAGSPPTTAAEARRLALPSACALELVHTYSLVHDDLPAMDNDTLRRGQPTLHVVYGEGLAILGGDGLLTEAFALMSREPLDADGHLAPRRLRAIARLAEAAGAAGMVGGQAIDLQLSGQTPAARVAATARNLDSLRDMHARKTGALIRAAAAVGAIMAGAADPLIDAVDAFAADVGLAFQIVDDILDVEGTDTDLGKTAGKDAAAGKLTYPSLVGLDASRTLARDAIARAAAALTRVALPRERLLGLADWVIARRQ
jgi:geranylgeranyl diphosphate synthase type II